MADTPNTPEVVSGTNTTTIILVILLIGAGFYLWKQSQKNKTAPQDEEPNPVDPD